MIAADPAGELGPQCAARFGNRLPFLLKVLSAAQALSIQVHPSRAQAQAGYAAENERGLPPDDPARNYVDDWPKPELLCALTPFEVLAGLRDPADAAAYLRALDVAELLPLAADLAAAAGPGAMAHALASILCWPDDDRERLVGDVVAASARLARTGGPYAEACAAAVRVAGHHPGDLGVAAMPLLRHAVLLPGQAVFMPAGGLHAYLHGTGIEVLANSDNVVRAGLTGKHVDVPELLKLLDPAVEVPVLSPRQVAAGVSRWVHAGPGVRAVPDRSRCGRHDPAGRRAADPAVHGGLGGAPDPGRGRGQGQPRRVVLRRGRRRRGPLHRPGARLPRLRRRAMMEKSQ